MTYFSTKKILGEWFVSGSFSLLFLTYQGQGWWNITFHMSFAVFTAVYARHNCHTTSPPKDRKGHKLQLNPSWWNLSLVPGKKSYLMKNPRFIYMDMRIYTYQHQGFHFSEFSLWDLPWGMLIIALDYDYAPSSELTCTRDARTMYRMAGRAGVDDITIITDKVPFCFRCFWMDLDELYDGLGWITRGIKKWCNNNVFVPFQSSSYWLSFNCDFPQWPLT